MAEHYFLYPFGINGNLLAIPNPTQVSGSVSYQAGFPIGYELANTAPGYLPIPRNQFNQLMFDATGAIQQLQQTGFPSWITSAANGGSPFAYGLGAQVWQGGIPYRSLIANNTDTPPTANWAVIGQNTFLYFNFAADTGSANNYVTAPNPAIPSLAAGQVVQLQPQFANTGACNLNVNGLGAVSIKTLANVDPLAGMIIPSGMYQLEYNAVTNAWVLQNPTLGSAAYVNTGTSSGQVPLNSQLGTAAYLNVGTATANIVQLISTGLPAVSGQNLTNLPAQFTAAWTGSGTGFPGGKIVLGSITIQCGTKVVSGTTAVTFPTAFSGTPVVVAFPGGSYPPQTTTTVPSVGSVSSTGFSMLAFTTPGYWIAIGPT